MSKYERSELGQDFQQDIKVSRYNLVEDSELQSQLTYYYNDLLSEEKSELDRLEVNLETQSAKLEIYVRGLSKEKLQNSYAVSKTTDSIVKAIIDSDEKIVSLKKQVGKQKEKVNRLKAIVKSLEDRNSQIKVLKDLYTSNYFTINPEGLEDNKNPSDQQRKILNNKKEE